MCDHNVIIKILCLSQLLKLLEKHRVHIQMGIAHGYAHVFYNVVTALVGKGREPHVISLDLYQAFFTDPQDSHVSGVGSHWFDGDHFDEEVAGWAHSVEDSSSVAKWRAGHTAFLRDQCRCWHCVTLLVTQTLGLSALSGEGARRKHRKGLEQDNY